MIYIVNANEPKWSWATIYVVEASDRIEAIKKVRAVDGNHLGTNIQIASQDENALEPIQVHFM